jgi:hypothetical protein
VLSISHTRKLRLALSMVITLALFTIIPTAFFHNLISDAQAVCPNPPCIAPKPTTLMLYPVEGTVNFKAIACSTIEITGKLTFTTTGRGIGGETITFSSDNGGPVPPARVTNKDGTYWADFKAPCSIGPAWHIGAQYAGDLPDIKGSHSAVKIDSTVKFP